MWKAGDVVSAADLSFLHTVRSVIVEQREQSNHGGCKPPSL